MRISVVIDSMHGGHEHHILPLIHHFISKEHTVQLILFKRDCNIISAIPEKTQLIVLDSSPSIFSALNPLSGLRKWLQSLKRWGDSDLILCLSSKAARQVVLANIFEGNRIPIVLSEQISSGGDTGAGRCIKQWQIRKFRFCHVGITGADLIEQTELLDGIIREYKKENDRRPVFKSGQKVLWVELGGLGDVAQAAAQIKLMKESFPEIKIFVLIRPQWKRFVETQPCIDGIICGDKKPVGIMLGTAKKIRLEKFDWMSDIRSGGSRAFFLQLLCAVQLKIPFCSERPREKSLLETTLSQKNDGYIMLSELHGKRLFICPGAGGSKLKRWPTEYWIQFLSELVNEGWSAVICGNGKEEKKISTEITAHLPQGRCIDLVDKIMLEDILGIISSCTAAIGNDTGLLHIAALAGLPTLGIFSYPTAWRVGFRMPWFIEVTACNEIKRFRWEDKRTKYVLESLTPDKVKREFNRLTRPLCTKNDI